MKKGSPVACVMFALGLVFIGLAAHAAPASADDHKPILMRRLLHTRLAFEPTARTGTSTEEFAAIGAGYAVTLRSTGADLWIYSTDLPQRPPAARSPFSSRHLNPVAADFETKFTDDRLELIGANGAAQPSPLEKLPGTMNYFVGNDPARWRTNISTYGKVKFANVYPGI